MLPYGTCYTAHCLHKLYYKFRKNYVLHRMLLILIGHFIGHNYSLMQLNTNVLT